MLKVNQNVLFIFSKLFFIIFSVIFIQTLYARNKTIYSTEIRFGAQEVILADGCLAIGGYFTSGSFFQGMERIEKNGIFFYYLRNQRVSKYPDRLDVTIRIAGAQCLDSNREDVPAFLTENPLVKFETAWKRGMDLIPAKTSECTLHHWEDSFIYRRQKKYPSKIAEYRMSVMSDGVPISDHLIVTIRSRQDTVLARISAGP